MKLGYYHYYLKEKGKRNAPRVQFDLAGLFAAYVNHEDTDWKKSLEVEEGESCLLVLTETPGVYMLVVTKQQEIIKAICTQTLSCADIRERLNVDETTGFAAYLKVESDFIALASTLKGPRTSALSRFVQLLLNHLNARKWGLKMETLGSSISLDEARGMAFVASSKIKVGPQNGLFRQVKELFSVDCDNVGSFEIIMRGKPRKNLKDVFTEMVKETDLDDLKRMQMKGREHATDALTDYFVEADGKFSEDLGTGTESQITQRIRSFVASNEEVDSMVAKIKHDSIYEENHIQELDRLSDGDHWSACLQSNALSSNSGANPEAES